MNCFVFILFLFVNIIKGHHLRHDILEYFNSGAVDTMKKEWTGHRPSLEHAIATALQEVIGKNSLNVFMVKPTNLKLAKGFSHQHGRVHIVFMDMELTELPQCWMPTVSFSLSSNIIKIESKLTKMIVTADYFVMRNKSDLVSTYDAFKHSPFLFDMVSSMGRAAITLDACILSGYIITKLSGESINLGHHKFTLTKCHYAIEISQLDAGGAPPVIAEYSAMKPGISLGLTQLVLLPMRGELVSKIQGVLFSYVNTSAIFGRILPALEDEQSLIFHKTLSNLTSAMRLVNEDVAKTNEGAVNIDDFFITWDDVTPFSINDLVTNVDAKGGLRLTNMLMTGLDTGYLSNSGGPYKLDSPMIGEQIRFSTLQIRGEVSYTKERKDKFHFAIEIRDFAVDIDIDVNGKQQTRIEMVGFRELEFSEPRVVFAPSQAIITSHILNEIPMLLSRIIKINIATQKNNRDYDSYSDTDSDASKAASSETAPGKKRLWFSSPRGVKSKAPHSHRGLRGRRGHRERRGHRGHRGRRGSHGKRE